MSSRKDRKLDIRRVCAGAVNALCCLLKVLVFGLEDVRDKLLRVAVDDREPRRLDLDHDPMSSQKHVVMISQGDVPFRGLAGGEGMRSFEALQITAAANFHGDGQLVAIQRLGC